MSSLLVSYIPAMIFTLKMIGFINTSDEINIVLDIKFLFDYAYFKR